MIQHPKRNATPRSVDNKPLRLVLRPGKYFWCACGRSIQSPWCDGSHYGTGIRPLRFVMDSEQECQLCQCKKSEVPPFCDSTSCKAT